jgi:hypothetical protein
MRNDLEDNSVFNQTFKSGRFSHSRKVLDADVLITQNGSLVNFLDPNGVDRTATLPEWDDGRFYVVSNVGMAFDILVENHLGGLITTLIPGDTALLFASDSEWVALRGWAALGVFTNTINGLVPAPNSPVPGSLFLRDDGQWAQVQVTGIVDAFKFVTDGTNTAIGAGPDTLRVRSSSGQVNAVVTNNEAVFGDNINFSVNEAAINHDLLLNFFADEHVGHSTVTLTAGVGLSGGGDITVSRTFDLDLNDLTTDTPVLTDTFAFYDVSGSDTNKATLTVLNGILNHNSLLNYVADQHVAHSGVSIIAGVGLSGGGDITTSRTLNLNINGLTTDSIVNGDFIPFYDLSGTDNNKISFANFTAAVDHNALLNYVANRHIDHTAVTLTAGAGLTGGGDISASRSFDVGAGVGITVNANDVALNINGLTADTLAVGDFFPFYDISGSDHNKITIANLNAFLDHNVLTNYVANQHVDHTTVSIATAAGTSGLSGGGTIAATRNLTVDINGLTADASPDSATDYIMTYDASATALKKVLLSNLPSGGGAVIYTGSQALTDAQKLQARRNIGIGVPDVILEEQQPTNTAHGGTATSGAWRTRTLNTKVKDPNSLCTLASNQFTLAAGTYSIRWHAPAAGCDRHVTRIQNITDGTTAGNGSSEYSGTTGVADFSQTRSSGICEVTIAASKAFELQHQVVTTRATTGFGISNVVAVDIYSHVEITKL